MLLFECFDESLSGGSVGNFKFFHIIHTLDLVDWYTFFFIFIIGFSYYINEYVLILSTKSPTSTFLKELVTLQLFLGSLLYYSIALLVNLDSSLYSLLISLNNSYSLGTYLANFSREDDLTCLSKLTGLKFLLYPEINEESRHF